MTGAFYSTFQQGYLKHSGFEQRGCAVVMCNCCSFLSLVMIEVDGTTDNTYSGYVSTCYL